MRQSIFRGKTLELDLETVRLPNGREATLEMVRHPGGAAVLAVDEPGRVCLLRQFRHAAGGYIWELPAGKIDTGEPPLATAQRELAEEAGCRAARWDALGDCLSSPGLFTEVVYLFLARELTPVPARPHDHEVFTVEWRPFSSVLHMAATGELRDGKSLAALLRALERFPELRRD